MIGPGDKYSPEREATPKFLETVGQWVDSSSEVFVVLRYLRAAGAKDYAFIKTRAEFAALVASVPDGTDIVVFRDSQLPLRGKVTTEFIARAKTHVRERDEYMFVRMPPERAGNLRLFGEMGDTHATLGEDLGEEMGGDVAFGACPRFIDPDSEHMISASKGESVVLGRPTHNKSVETNRRPAFPLNTGRQFERVSCAPPSLSAAVAHLCR